MCEEYRCGAWEMSGAAQFACLKDVMRDFSAVSAGSRVKAWG